MPIIDPTTSLGKCRLRCGDFSDIVLLPDAVYAQALTDANDNIVQASLVCAMYILASLTSSTHRRLATIETWGNSKYEQYKDYLMLLAKDPSFNGVCPLPYSASGTDLHPIVQFQQDWEKNYSITQSQQLAFDASNSPNDGSTYGILGSASGSGWQEV